MIQHLLMTLTGLIACRVLLIIALVIPAAIIIGIARIALEPFRRSRKARRLI